MITWLLFVPLRAFIRLFISEVTSKIKVSFVTFKCPSGLSTLKCSNNHQSGFSPRWGFMC